jgi:hypothetical protein
MFELMLRLWTCTDHGIADRGGEINSKKAKMKRIVRYHLRLSMLLALLCSVQFVILNNEILVP